MGAVGGPGIFPRATSVSDKSTEEACMVHVPGTALFGSGHCVVMAGLTLVFQASGSKTKSLNKDWPRAGPQSSPGLTPVGPGSASAGWRAWTHAQNGAHT